MSIIVRHKESNELYILIGSSYSFFKDSRPSFLGGVLFPHEEEGLFNLTAVADESGNIRWIPTDDLQVIGVEGQSIKGILDHYKALNPVQPASESDIECDYCLGCGYKVSPSDMYCPSCGLVFVAEE